MKKAFTLIELLVVIAIIAILAAILFPVFAQAKLAAKKTQAISNVKNIGTAHMLYVGDYDDVSPKLGGAYYRPQDGQLQGIDIEDQLYPYIKNTQIWIDPSRNDIDTGCDPLRFDEPGCRLAGYGYNWGPIMRRGGGMLGRQVADPINPATNWIPGLNMTSIDSPAQMFAYGETYDTPRITMTATFLLCTFTGSKQSDLRYGGVWPTAFADGHAKAIQWRAGWGDPAAENNEFAVPANLDSIVGFCADPNFVLDSTTWSGGHDSDIVPSGTLCKDLPAFYKALPVAPLNSGSGPAFLP